MITRMADPVVGAEPCTALGAATSTIESYPGRDVALEGLRVTRVMPIRDRRMVGPWCFLDRFGPLSFGPGKPMDVAPHPHVGLQTVTWLLSGEVLHDDSLGYAATARPGGVNVMTAGSGIAHAEQTPESNSGSLDGVQLWVALPDASRAVAPSFTAIAEVPPAEQRGGVIRVFSGGLDGVASPAPHYSCLVGAEVQVLPNASVEHALDPSFEHAMLTLDGDAAFEGTRLEPRRLYYLGTRRTSATLSSRSGARVLLLGGPPFAERILMWWNFVARTPEEIASARADWIARRRFGEVAGYRGPRLDAPELARLARANPMS